MDTSIIYIKIKLSNAVSYNNDKYNIIVNAILYGVEKLNLSIEHIVFFLFGNANVQKWLMFLWLPNLIIYFYFIGCKQGESNANVNAFKLRYIFYIIFIMSLTKLITLYPEKVILSNIK